MTTVSGDTANARTVGAYGLNSAFVESEVTWNIGSSTNNWTNGGNFGSVLATTTVTGLAQYSWSSASLTTLVGGWVTTPANNFGFIIGDTAGGTVLKNFATKENGTASARPVLTVTYTGGPTSPATTTALTVNKLLVTDSNPSTANDGPTVVVTMTATAGATASGVTVTAPATLTATKLGATAATATYVSGPTNSPATIPAAGGSVSFTWTYRLDAGSAAGVGDQFTFSGTPTRTGLSAATFAAGTSPGVIVTPPLTFTVNVPSPILA